MNVLLPLIAVLAVSGLTWLAVGVARLELLFAVALPYAAIVAFLAGVVWRVLSWARVPVPFNITTTCGQQTSLPWIRSSVVENPHTRLGVIARMALEILCFRSLFRNVRHEFVSRANYEPRLAYKTSLWLWAGALAFHYSFLTVFLRHYRFFSDPVPRPLQMVETLDGFFQVGSPTIFLSGFVLLAAVGFLLLRRLLLPRIRYISLAADYFPLFLLIGIALTGILMRYTALRVDITEVKNLCMGLMRFQPDVPTGRIGSIFYVHLTLVSVLFAYLPFSKMSHMMGVFLSPARNMRGASRMHRHVNPWNYPVEVHTYEEYENDFRDKMKAAGIPVDKE
ncbi:sulfate reduction electron transfer complex DsrMKJOP subunit DsrM [Candidatus Sumerlaeota bacterium]|nr:sulfate reduction electron transfer complex DsrMKJOP subunit DsrM [Candidatus Sumerlaeota bacterium]